MKQIPQENPHLLYKISVNSLHDDKSSFLLIPRGFNKLKHIACPDIRAVVLKERIHLNLAGKINSLVRCWNEGGGQNSEEPTNQCQQKQSA